MSHFRAYLGQNGGQKGQNVPFSRRNEYYELEFCNYKLNHVEKLTITQMKHKNLFLAPCRCLPGSKGSKYALFLEKCILCAGIMQNHIASLEESNSYTNCTVYKM